MSEITQLLARVSTGDEAARASLYSLVYPDLRRLARSRLRGREPITLLDTTSLLHESYLRFAKAHGLSFEDRGRFFAFAASMMRSIITDAIRKRRAERHGGGAEHVEFDTGVVDASQADEDLLLRVHEALHELAALEPRLAQVVEMRYFAGLTEVEVAAVLGLTERTVRRDWDKARMLLHAALK